MRHFSFFLNISKNFRPFVLCFLCPYIILSHFQRCLQGNGVFSFSELSSRSQSQEGICWAWLNISRIKALKHDLNSLHFCLNQFQFSNFHSQWLFNNFVIIETRTDISILISHSILLLSVNHDHFKYIKRERETDFSFLCLNIASIMRLHATPPHSSACSFFKVEAMWRYLLEFELFS